MRSTNSLEYETHAVKFFLMLACHYALNHTGIVTFDCIKTKQTGFLLKWSITQGTLKQSNVLQLTTHEWTLSNIMRTAALSHSQKKYWRFFTMLLTCMSNTSSLRLWFFSHLLRYVIPFCSARAYVSVNWIYLASFQHKKDINMMTEVAVTSHCFYRLEKFQQHSISNEFCIYVNSFLK